MPMSQLETDLTNNASERLRAWVIDTLMRCDVVEFDVAQKASMIFSCLADELFHLADKLNMSSSDFTTIIQSGYTDFRALERRRKKSQT
jgi:hypothetical protein